MNHTSFFKLLSSRFLYSMAVQIQALVLGWQMYTLTHSPVYLGLIGLAEAVPALSLALFSGYLIDRSNPMKMLTFSIVVGLVSASFLWAPHLPGIHLGLKLQIICLFLSSFLTGISRSFLHPSVFAIVPRIVERSYLPKSSAWMTMAYQTASVSGPAIGGLLFGFFGIFTAASVVVGLTTLSLLGLSLTHFAWTPAPQQPVRGRFKVELMSGLRFVFKHPLLLPALSLDMISVLFGGITALLPIYAAEILFVGPIGLGWLRAATAIGAGGVSLALTQIEIKKKAGRLLLGSVTGFGVCILVFAISKNYVLSFGALLLSGMFDSVSAVIRSALVQLSSPDELRGRISAVNMVFISSSNELGEFESGMAAKLLGTVPAAVFGGIVCLLTVGTVTLFSKPLRELDLSRLRPEETL
ncbi:MAG: MFS transporter [Candidatus Margulisiibacteriota bacterium]